MLSSPNPDKTTTPQQLHEEWLHTLPNHTVVIYTDGSKLENGSVGCGWATFHCGDQQLYRLGEGSCHLGNRAEVYDAKLHTIQEAVTSLLRDSEKHVHSQRGIHPAARCCCPSDSPVVAT